MAVFIAPNATVVGRVVLGKNVSVWYGAVVRADVEIVQVGANCNIQDLAVLHADPGFPCILEESVTVGHAAIVHGAKVGAGSMIGMHATVLNGAVIGKQCLIAAGALVKEGMHIPDHSMVVGVPAKILRTLDPKDLEWLQASAPNYVAVAKAHAEGQFPIHQASDFDHD